MMKIKKDEVGCGACCKVEWRRLLGIPRYRWNDNIKMELKGIGL
jgi:hypothetical protein